MIIFFTRIEISCEIDFSNKKMSENENENPLNTGNGVKAEKSNKIPRHRLRKKRKNKKKLREKANEACKC
jgi:hypothetical protein